MNRTVTAILSSMHRNVEASYELHLCRMALLPTVLSLALEFVNHTWIYNCTCINNEYETTTTTTQPLEPVASALVPCWVHLFWTGDTLPNEACEMLAALANIVARSIMPLCCWAWALGPAGPKYS
jgi:hypothetical protein